MRLHSLLLAAVASFVAHALEGFAKNGNVTLHYQVSGQGPPILLLHGFPDNSDTWSEQVARLESTNTVIRPTLRGYPPSDIPLITEENYNLTTIAGDAIAILDHLKIEKAIVGGHDFGGAAIQLIPLLFPERVDGLILINTPLLPHFYDVIKTDKSQQEMANYTLDFIAYKPGDPVGRDIDYLIRGVPNQQSHRDELKKYLSSTRLEGMFAYYKYNYPAPPYDVAFVDTSTFPKNEVPTLILWGLEDPAFSLKLLNGIPDHFKNTTRLVTLPGVGHWSLLEQPDRVNDEIVSWLNFLKTQGVC
ncbi:hypothetical protein CPLU01_11172 [Colletotrichum plurivorum]|uniref:AB hydrolase-1 domain-containing protein n=1 Tax=Colletotrichum plurivorum TaxID=2175906 RepID=A0A8H6N8R8_9PEZI|nr:hypothetical protein CPLU01_11172 [Colletotrichum plurivorum]